MVPLRAGFGTLRKLVAGRSQGQVPHALLHDYFNSGKQLNSLSISSFPAVITNEPVFSETDWFADVPLRVMVIVGYTCRTDRFPASAAHKEKLQMKFVSHFYADVVLCCHLDFCRALSEESEFFII